MRIFVAAVLAVLASSAAHAETTFVLQNDPTDDEHFVIADKVFSAKTYCFGWSQGDQLVFVDGNQSVCVSMNIYNKRTHKLCEVWCP